MCWYHDSIRCTCHTMHQVLSDAHWCPLQVKKRQSPVILDLGVPFFPFPIGGSVPVTGKSLVRIPYSAEWFQRRVLEKGPRTSVAQGMADSTFSKKICLLGLKCLWNKLNMNSLSVRNYSGLCSEWTNTPPPTGMHEQRFSKISVIFHSYRTQANSHSLNFLTTNGQCRTVEIKSRSPLWDTTCVPWKFHIFSFWLLARIGSYEIQQCFLKTLHWISKWSYIKPECINMFIL